MKKIIAVILAAILLLSFCGCSNESKGVPEEKIEDLVKKTYFYTYFEDTVEYKFDVKHNVNENTHTDNAVIDLEVIGEYGTFYATYEVRYIYDRASDLWSYAGGLDTIPMI